MGFDSFVGNAAAVGMLREMLRDDRMPGALLFTGPEGVGKRTLALMAAKAAVCQRLKDDFCGECAHCRRADEMIASARDDLVRRSEMKEAGRRLEGLVYFDLQLIAPFTRYILTEQIRLLRQVSYARPFELPRRFFIIDQAQAIHWQAVDLLLKVMEEPPETTTFILVCPNAGELRPTIRSRCQRVPFLPVDEALIARLLAERTQVPETERALLARLAGGSVGKALSLDIHEYLARREPWLGFLDSVAVGRRAAGRGGSGGRRSAPDWQRLFDATRALGGDREHFEETLGIGQALLRDLLQMLAAGDRSRVTHLDLVPRLKRWAQDLGLGGIEMLKQGLDQAYRQQVRNVNQQLGLDALAIGLMSRELQ
jgi:DNA polymerase III subunit delta'